MVIRLVLIIAFINIIALYLDISSIHTDNKIFKKDKEKILAKMVQNSADSKINKEKKQFDYLLFGSLKPSKKTYLNLNDDNYLDILAYYKDIKVNDYFIKDYLITFIYNDISKKFEIYRQDLVNSNVGFKKIVIKDIDNDNRDEILVLKNTISGFKKYYIMYYNNYQVNDLVIKDKYEYKFDDLEIHSGRIIFFDYNDQIVNYKLIENI